MAIRWQAVHALAAAGGFLALALALTASGCSSDESDAEGETTPTVQAGPPTVQLEDQTETTGGKVLLFTASTNAQLIGAGGPFVVELRGIDLERDKRATYDEPDYAAATACDTQPCEWAVYPDAATTYEFRAFVVDPLVSKPAGQSSPVRAVWKPPPRPEDVKLLINGKSMPLTALDGGDVYLPIAPGKQQVEAQWKGDVSGTGYAVLISTAEPEERDYATCSTGTSCVVPEQVPLLTDQEMSWEVKLVTTQGEKVAKAFKVCLVGRA